MKKNIYLKRRELRVNRRETKPLDGLNRIKKIGTTVFVALVLILSVSFVVPDTAIGQPPPPPSKPDATPIDGGLGLLAAAGGAYAIKKLRDRKE